MRQLQTASSDNIQWTLSQAEVEYLEYEKALDGALVAGSPDLSAVRRQFDIFYSRIATLSNGSVYRGLDKVEGAGAALQTVKQALDVAVPTIDAGDAALKAELGNFKTRTNEIRGVLRTLSTTGLRYFAHEADLRREGLLWTLSLLAFVTTLLIIALIVLGSGLVLLS